jgi:SAM-dependent methyltransferase
MALDEKGAEYAEQVGSVWGVADETIRSWWQSPVAVRECNRRITGDPLLSPPEYFKRRYCEETRGTAISLGAGGGELERQMLDLGVCQSILGVDISRQRVDSANATVPAHLRDRLRFECHNLETWRPRQNVDLVIARDALHHIAGLEELCEGLREALEPGGLVYCDEFIGPARFQWTDRQLAVVNRLLERLPDQLARDLVDNDGSRRRNVGRPDVEALIAADPSEAIRSNEIPDILSTYFESLERRPYGGALFHQFFNRIMGNFAGHEDVVALVMEFDFILCDEGVLTSDYEWGIYQRRC